MKKKLVIGCIVLCVVIACGIGAGYFFGRYVPLYSRSKYIEFHDFMEDAKVSTGVIKDNKVEEKLNKAGFFDSEIRKLGKEELKYLNNCKDVNDLKVKVNFYKYIDDKEKLIPFSKSKISGKKIDTRNSVMYSNAMISVYQNINVNKKNTDDRLGWNLITVNTWYGTPKKLGRDYIRLDVGKNESITKEPVFYVHYNYEAYNKKGLFKVKKIKKQSISTKDKFIMYDYSASYNNFYAKIPKLKSYVAKEDKIISKKNNSILVNKGYDFYKVRDISCIMSIKISKGYNTLFAYNALYYYHNVRNLDNSKVDFTLSQIQNNETNLLFNNDDYNAMCKISNPYGSDIYLKYDMEKDFPNIAEKILDEDEE